MSTTRESLLRAVRDPGDGSAWAQFYELYAPMIFAFAKAQGLPHHDAEEVRDRCLAALARKMKDFDYRPERGRFHGYLYRMALGHVHDLRRRERARRAVPLATDWPAITAPEEDWRAVWQSERLRFALARARSRASARDAWVFDQLLSGRDAAELAEAAGLRRNHVYKIRGRMLEEVRRLLDRC